MIKSNRDNFTEVVKLWCEYAAVAQAAGHQPITLQHFMLLECNWDTPNPVLLFKTDADQPIVPFSNNRNPHEP